MEKGLVSVIVPVYNTKDYLPKCLDSIISQTYRNLEIILVDDGSTDGSAAVCDTYSKKDDRFVVLHNENHGVSYTRNCGVDAARGEFIAFIDSDDYVTNDYIEVLHTALVDNDADISKCNFYFEEKGELRLASRFKNIQGENRTFERDEFLIFWRDFDNMPHNGSFMMHTACMCLFKTSIIKENGLVHRQDMKIYEDVLFMLTYIYCTKRVTLIWRPMYFYVRREISASHSASSERLAKAIFVFCCYLWEMRRGMKDIPFKKYLESRVMLESNFLGEYYNKLLERGEPTDVFDKIDYPPFKRNVGVSAARFCYRSIWDNERGLSGEQVRRYRKLMRKNVLPTFFYGRWGLKYKITYAIIAFCLPLYHCLRRKK